MRKAPSQEKAHYSLLAWQIHRLRSSHPSQRNHAAPRPAVKIEVQGMLEKSAPPHMYLKINMPSIVFPRCATAKSVK
jgi:hypothetical protein